jgi:23S rRNA pseudouridine2605 synthase
MGKKRKYQGKRKPRKFLGNESKLANQADIAKLTTKEEVIGMRLNKYIAFCGVCSRRAAAEAVKDGKVVVNNEICMEPFYQIKKGDEVKFEGALIRPAEQLVYILLNKPKNVITTTDDEKGRKTVLDLIGTGVSERIFPVGRLDRNTTGLLLLTNDGVLAQKLTHPKHEKKKIYHVELDQPLSTIHFNEINKGLELEDGLAPVDALGYLDENDHCKVGITIHIGRNRIVRRIFQHLGYEVLKLDRVYFAGLTKKDLPRGKFRQLSHREVIMLKHFT